MNKKLIVIALVVAFVLAFSSVASAEFVKGFDKNLELYPNWIVNGETQPIFTYSQAITEIVYVEVPCDTDRDGLRDRVSVYIMRPRTAEGFLCPVMLEHSPYHNGTVGWNRVSGTAFNDYAYMREPFHYRDNWPIHIDPSDPAFADTTNLSYDDIKYQGIEAHEWSWGDAPFETGSWYTGDNYGNVPAATVSAIDPITGQTLYEPAPSYSWSLSNYYRYYLPRGYALVYGQLLGNRDSDGITDTLHIEEVLSAMAVIKWFNGEAKGYTSRRGNVEVKADWANGNVAMTGTSYPADISFATVVTGVKGLKAVMPQCNGLNWYDYYRYAGSVNSPGGYGGEDLNIHASFNFSRFNADVSSGVPPANGTWFPKAIQDVFFETQKHMIEKEDSITGDYNTEWELRNFGRLVENINPDVGLLMTTGFMDWNSQPKLSMANWTVLLDKCPGVFREFASISSHASQAPAVVHGKSMVEWWLLWMDHFLLGLDNNVVESLPDLTVINTKTGAVEGYDVNRKAQPEDQDYLVRGGIIPGAKNQKIYFIPGTGGKAGRLSYNAPAPATEHFNDMYIEDMLQATYPGAPTLSAAYQVMRTSSDGNYRVTTGSGTTSQSQFCEGRFVGVNRTYNFGVTATTPAAIQSINEQIFAAVDIPIEGRLMYLSEPLAQDVRYSGTGLLHLVAAPDIGSGTISAALVEIGRVRNMESSRADAWSMSVGTGNNLLTAAPYTLPYGGGISGNISIGTFRNPSEVGTYMNYKYVTVGYADVQNPDYAGKAWFDVPEQNYIPNFYFQTTKIVPGQYYPYTVELDPYDYVFHAGSQIGVMIFGTDPDYTLLYDEDCVPQFDIKIAESYAMLPMKLDEPYDPVTIEVSSALVLPGDTVDITYSIADNDYGFSVLDLDIPFVSSVYTPVAVTPAALLSGGTFGYSIAGGVLNVTYNSLDNTVGDGELFTVTYQVDANAYAVLNHPLNVTVNTLQFASLMDKLYDVKVTVKHGYLNTNTFYVYLETAKTNLVVGEAFQVDVMLVGGANYTQFLAEIEFDPNLLTYVGYQNLKGWVAACAPTAAGKIAVRSVPTMNAVAGEPSNPALTIVTLNFKVKDDLGAYGVAGALSLPTASVFPTGGYIGATTAKSPDIELSLSTLTYANLYAAVQGETNAAAAYRAFAAKAADEGYDAIAKLFTATADAEAKHADDEWAILAGMGATDRPVAATPTVGATLANLQTAFDGETYEYTTMYPAFVTDAQAEGIVDAERIFNYAGQAEAVHAGNYAAVLALLQANNYAQIATDYATLYRCVTCGEVVNALPTNCPICGRAGNTFVTY